MQDVDGEGFAGRRAKDEMDAQDRMDANEIWGIRLFKLKQSGGIAFNVLDIY